MGQYSALDIANWFIYKTNSEMKEHQSSSDEYDIYEGITHLKLQKLLYFAQGMCLSVYECSLFEDPIIAWEHGPVVPKVYSEYKKYGRKYIPTNANTQKNKIVTIIENDPIASKVLNLVYENFAIYTAWQLREMTHEINSPWDSTVKKQGLNSIVNNELIKDYFNENYLI